MDRHRLTYPPRRGFTLIELLVVIALIGILAALVVAFFPSINAGAREASGAAQFQNWLSTARQKALRNQTPYGLRLWIKEQDDFIDPTTKAAKAANAMHYVVSKCQYVEQPDDFTGGTLGTWDPDPTIQNDFSFVFIRNVDVTAGYFSAGLTELYSVQPLDYLEIAGTGHVHQIMPFAGQVGPPATLPPTPWKLPPSPSFFNPVSINLSPPDPAGASFLLLNTKVPFKIAGTTSYRVIRQPRITGEEPLELPEEIVVDLKVNYGDLNTDNDGGVIPNGQFRNPLPIRSAPSSKAGGATVPAYIDVIFAPNGALLTNTSATTLNFFVRSLDHPYPYGGEPTIIAVTTKTGFVGAYKPVPSAVGPAPANANPYALVK